MNAYRGNIGIGPRINRDVRLRRVVSFTPQPLNRREGTQGPIYEAGWSPEPDLLFLGSRTLDRPARSLVSIPTTQPRSPNRLLWTQGLPC